MSEWVKNIVVEKHEQTVLHALGIRVEKVDADETVVSMAVDDRHKQHVGLVHGGIYVLLAETVMSLAAACALKDPRDRVVAIEINANHIKSATSGTLWARSSCLHAGHTTLVYEAQVSGDAGLISIARSTMMVIKPK
jgi:1,4-dihydroxy-2-naphthoyl-CoA hydrolase